MKIESRYGVYLTPSGPMMSRAIPSRTNSTRLWMAASNLDGTNRSRRNPKIEQGDHDRRGKEEEDDGSGEVERTNREEHVIELEEGLDVLRSADDFVDDVALVVNGCG